MPVLGQQLELLIEVGEQLRCRVGPHDDRRVPVEGHDRGRTAQLGRHGPDLADEMPVPEMHPVVGADGDHTAGRRWRAGARVVEGLHRLGGYRSPVGWARSTTAGLALPSPWLS